MLEEQLMKKWRYLLFVSLILMLGALPWGVKQARAVPVLTPGVDYNFPHFAYSPAPAVTAGTCSVTTTTACYTNANCPSNETCNGVVVGAGGMRKFVDSLAGLGAGARPVGSALGANGLGQYIPIATPSAAPAGVPWAGTDDYYEIALVEYRERMHSDLPPVTGSWPNQSGGTKLRGYVQEINGIAVGTPHYLGPLIIATKNRPVRIKFTNRLPIGAGGKLFLPVDTSIMGAGEGALTATGAPCDPALSACAEYTQNRATIHLHGGLPGWVSDGTAHQWITPASEATPYLKGASQQNVPDMAVPANGSATFHWPNQQSGRLMFYHDHAYGLTGLNVYAGEAAGYLLVDPAEETALSTAGVPTDLPHLIPLVIQDKTFVPATVLNTDPLWDTVNWGGLGSLWFPHVYVPNQDPYDISGANPLGRWDYGQWFWPVFPVDPPYYPPALSHVPEAFMDTPVINGTAYPYLEVAPAKYRLRILNACNDRMVNLQLYQADPANGGAPVGLGGLTEVKMVPAVPTTICTNPNVPNVPPGCFPASWAVQTPGMIPEILDGRAGGVPDPSLRGPAMIQIGTEGGLLTAPALLANTPVGYEQNKRNIVVLNVSQKTLFLAPAERADVIVDFTNFAGKTVILYNDSPAPVPAGDPRYDFYTGNLDYSATGGANYQGGAPSTLAGFGPNTRTIMQFRVSGSGGSAPVDDFPPALLTALNGALPTIFATGQDPLIVGPNVYARISSNYLPLSPQPLSNITVTAGGTGYTAPPTVTLVGGDGTGAVVGIPTIANGAVTSIPLSNPGTGYTNPPTVAFAGGGGIGAKATANIANAMFLQPKAIQELFDPNGRMNATLGVELPFTTSLIQTTIPYGFIDPTTETFTPNETQLWKLTHNGVDTHGIHFHLVNVQVVNRVGWDGAIRPPDDNELGWRDTVRMNPLEDIVVAMKAKAPALPFGLPNSSRLLDVARPQFATGPQFTNVDPLTGFPITVVNDTTNFGWEYTWHCHILGHEENDMMRPLVLAFTSTIPTAPVLSQPGGTRPYVLNWTDGTPVNYANPATFGNTANEIGFRIERATGTTGAFVPLSTALANVTTYSDAGAAANTSYRYRVVAFNAAGSATSNIVTVGAGAAVPAAPTNLNTSPPGGLAVRITGNNLQDRVTLTWTDNANNETGFQIQRSNFANFNAPTTFTVGANVTTFSQNVSRALDFYYRVRATNATGNSAWSNVRSVTTP
jgi:FtsP/CotA-like multicopper oxidase with cupredoxin domain